MRVEILVISSKSLDTEPCICIRIDNRNFHFNCPLLCQRSLVQSGIRLQTINCVCFTSLSSKAFSGFRGFCNQIFVQQIPICFKVLSNYDTYSLVKKELTFGDDESHVPKYVKELIEDDYI